MINIGSKELKDCKIGSRQVTSIYKGSTKIWSKEREWINITSYLLNKKISMYSKYNFTAITNEIPNLSNNPPIALKINMWQQYIDNVQVFLTPERNEWSTIPRSSLKYTIIYAGLGGAFLMCNTNNNKNDTTLSLDSTNKIYMQVRNYDSYYGSDLEINSISYLPN